MLCARKTAKNGEKRRFSNFVDFKKSKTAVNGPPLDFWVQNTLVHGKTACLTFPGKKLNLEEFLKKMSIFQPRFKG
jgi:hypothetical protein